MESLVTVVVPAYECEHTLERAIRSIEATGREDVEVVIVNDGSRDGTAEVARALVAEAPAVRRLVSHPDGGNHGVAESRNLGLREARSEWIAFLDADDSYLPNRFEGLESFAPTVDACYGTTRIVLDQEDATGRAWLESGDDRFGIREPLRGDALLAALLRGLCWAISAVTIRRSLLQRTGLFDTRKRIAEDCDLWMRLACAGHIEPLPDLPVVSLYHRHGANSFNQEVDHRLAVLQAILDTGRWALRAGVPAERRRIVAAAGRDYAFQSLANAVVAGRAGLGRDVLRAMLRARQFGFFLQPRVLRMLRALWRAEVSASA